MQNTNLSGSTILAQYDYTYDALGRRNDRTKSGSLEASNHTDTFSYDSLGQVTSSLNNTDAEQNFSYDYDAIGNRLLSSVGTATPAVSSYTSNDLNQYTAIHASEVWNPTYDLDGNLLNDGKFQYTWNGENRLIGVETHPSIATATGLGEKAEYTYDYQGRRIERKKYRWNNGSLTYDPVSITN